MAIPNASDIKIFVPAKNFQLSLDFYLALGWKMNWIHENSLAELEMADSRFLLQDFYVKDWAHNFMIYMVVDDANAWCKHVKDILNKDSKYDTCRVQDPKKEPYGLVTYVWDPSGVLIHFVESK